MLYSEVIGNDPDREWIVFVHGAGGSVRTWKYQVDAFKEHFNLLLLDLRDHGNSQGMAPPPDRKYSFDLMAQDILAVLDFQGIESAHFVGVSLGSIVVRCLEAAHSERVRSVVFGGGVFRLNRWLKMGIRTGLVAARLLPFKLLSRLLSFLVMPRGNHQKARRIFLREADRIDPHAYRKWIGLAGKIGKVLERFFKTEMASPCFVAMGSQDHVFLGPAADYARQFPKVKLHVIPGCGHVCNIERAEQFNALALEFLLQVSERKDEKANNVAAWV